MNRSDNHPSTEPRLRNPLLADAMKRIGIVERSGRGVDKIYRGMLRFGRPEPDYSRTDGNSVVLQLATVEADEAFLKLLIEEEERQGKEALSIDSLIVLAALREQKRLGMEALAGHMQRDVPQARRIIQQLVEAGLVQAHGSTRSRTYTLSVDIYQAKGEQAAYTRQAGFSKLQHEQMVLSFARQHGSIQRKDVMELCLLNGDQAYRLLQRLCSDGHLIKHGERRGSYYTVSP